ncbi:MAG: vWA domain-containing protein, partial [Planctomycetota bacterium]
MIRNLRRWWQIRTGRVETPFDGETPFWVVSLGFHLLAIVLLGWIMMPAKETPSVSLTVEEVVEVVEEEEELPPELQFDELISDQLGADGDSGFATAAAQAPVIDIANEDPIDLEMELRDVGELVTDNDFLEASAESFSTMAVKGSVGESVSAAEGAIDRMTKELLQSMEERQTVVVWLFDQSASLMRQRDQILKRFDRIYTELGIIQDNQDDRFQSTTGGRLLTQIYAFGSEINPLLRQPTDDLNAIKNAVRNIERDASGIENVMQAVIEAADQHDRYRKIDRKTGEPSSNVSIIVVSDEAGDDIVNLDKAIQICTKNQMPVYVIGVPAPFGRSETLVKWVDPDPKFDQTPQWAEVKQGPESVVPERLRLDFTGTFEDLNMIDSGFGPFHLTRLAYETGGIYFAVHPNRNTKRRVRRWETE